MITSILEIQCVHRLICKLLTKANTYTRSADESLDTYYYYYRLFLLPLSPLLLADKRVGGKYHHHHQHIHQKYRWIS